MFVETKGAIQYEGDYDNKNDEWFWVGDAARRAGLARSRCRKG